MSGPAYPPGPQPGSNAIGSFAIGISPVGDITAFNPWTTIISQYANSPILTSLILSFNAAMDLTAEYDSFFDLMWNVDTAQGYGLDVWGRIVGVTRTVQIPATGTTFFGFEEAGSWLGFNQPGGGFYSGAGGVTTAFTLDDANFRQLILAKAAGNISDGSIPAVNAILLALFPFRGDCYVQDNQNMSLNYVFNFPLSPVEVAIVSQTGVLPTAAGVSITIEQR